VNGVGKVEGPGNSRVGVDGTISVGGDEACDGVPARRDGSGTGVWIGTGAMPWQATSNVNHNNIKARRTFIVTTDHLLAARRRADP
jgi:hypothetical protein